MDPAMLGRLNTKSLRDKMEEKAKLLVNVLVDCYQWLFCEQVRSVVVRQWWILSLFRVAEMSLNTVIAPSRRMCWRPESWVNRSVDLHTWSVYFFSHLNDWLETVLWLVFLNLIGLCQSSSRCLLFEWKTWYFKIWETVSSCVWICFNWCWFCRTHHCIIIGIIVVVMSLADVMFCRH